MICFNKKVLDNYMSGMNINDALYTVHEDEIKSKIETNPAFEKLNPFKMALHDAGINKYSTIGDMMNSSTYTSGGLDTNEWLFPVWIETTLRENAYEQNLISYIVNSNIGIDGNTVQSPTLNLLSDKNENAIKKARIAEGADIPIGKISIGKRAITLWKRGRAIEMTYESVRRMRVDLFTKQMNAIASDLAAQNVDFAVDVIVNGDGNTDTAATEIATTEQAEKVTANDLINACYEYYRKNKFNATTIIAPYKYAKQIAGMTFDKNLMSGASANMAFNMPQFDLINLTVIAADVPKVSNKEVITLSNINNTLVRYVENGSNIQENQNFIRNQTKLMTFTENSGYAINTAGSNMYITIKTTT